MNIIVKTIDGWEFKIKVSNDDTFAQLKNEIQSLYDFTPDEQILLFQGTELSNDKSKLISCGIKNESVIYLSFKLRNFTVVVARQDGKSIKIPISSEKTVQYLKEQIHTSWNTPIEQQTLMFRDEILENNKKLSDYRIDKECLISLIPKVANFQQRTGPGMPVSSQLNFSVPSVTSGRIISNHHGDNVEKWSRPNKLHSLQRFSTVLTLYSFSKNQPDEMSFDANEILEVLDKSINDPGWWRCRNVNGDIGLVPSNYIKQLTSTGALMSKQQQPSQQQSVVIDQKQCTISNDSVESIRLSFNRTGRFKDCIWYWGAISCIECESLLMTSGYLGQFLVRDSESHSEKKMWYEIQIEHIAAMLKYIAGDHLRKSLVI